MTKRVTHKINSNKKDRTYCGRDIYDVMFAMSEWGYVTCSECLKWKKE